VLDLAEKRINVTKLKLKNQQIEYASQLEVADRPDFSKRTGTLQPVEDIAENDFSDTPKSPIKKPYAPRPVARITLIPKTYRLHVIIPKIAEIYKELRSLRLDTYPHAISVLLRVFLETSVDHYLTKANISLVFKSGGHDRDKSLKTKVEEATEHMVNSGAQKKDFTGVVRSVSDRNHPLSADILHCYVHNRFVSPTERDLTVAWDNAQPLFERIWP
jgi:hypothetical protein